MTVYDLLWRIASAYPTASLVLAIATFALVCLISWWIKRNMVTNQGLELALANFHLQMDEKFVTRQECEAMFHSKPNGKVQGASTGG